MDEKEFEETTGLPSKMMELTLGELVKEYGGPMQLDKWAGILSKLANASLMEEKIRVSKINNNMIDKDFVVSNVFNYINLFMDEVFDLVEDKALFQEIAKKTKEAITESIKKQSR